MASKTMKIEVPGSGSVSAVRSTTPKAAVRWLFAYAPGCSGSTSDYCHKFLVEADGVIKLGSLMNAKGQFGSLGLYAFLAYQISQVPSGTPSRNRMTLLAGLTLPLAPWHR